MGALIVLLTTLFLQTSFGPIAVTYEPTLPAIVVEGLEIGQGDSIDQRISVYFGELNESVLMPELIGDYRKEGHKILFRPKYGFVNGAEYTVVIGSTLGRSGRYKVSVPAARNDPSAYVANIYPSTSALPMNQLKFYIEFSKPMRFGGAAQYIKLYRMPEKVLETEAFLAMSEELWDPEGKRLTVFLDPGRIKRGVQPNLQLGLPLVEGRRYRLVIDKKWTDYKGATLTHDFVKEFTVVAVDRESPVPDDWHVQLPDAGTKEPLQITFNEVMDYGLLHSTIVVVNMENKRVNGTIQLARNEQDWLFTPNRPWGEGKHLIIINAWLEDLAGNNLRRKFDVDLNNPNDTPKTFKELKIPFVPIKQKL